FRRGMVSTVIEPVAAVDLIAVPELGMPVTVGDVRTTLMAIDSGVLHPGMPRLRIILMHSANGSLRAVDAGIVGGPDIIEPGRFQHLDTTVAEDVGTGRVRDGSHGFY